MTIAWLDAGEAEKFGQSLAQFFITRIPIPNKNVKSKVLTKQLETVDKMYLQIEKFKLNHKLNVYKKAKLASSFKDELIAAGYDSEFVEKVTYAMLQKL